jgi:hypothetical protein
MNRRRIVYLLPLIALALISLMLGLWSGLRRVGWGLPPLASGLVLDHGPLMVSGFVGTLISVERALAIGKRWSFLGPLCAGLGGLVLVIGGPEGVGSVLITLGSLALVFMFVGLPRKRLGWPSLVMTWGALAWFVGNALWGLGFPIHRVVLWWEGFLILTVSGERLELGELGRRWPTIRLTFMISLGLLLLGMVVSVWEFDFGARLAGAGMVSLGSWLLRLDIARKTARGEGMSAYIGRALLSGYVWLMLAGALGVLFGGAQAGPIYDASLHAVFLGFALVMIFAHAPLLLQAISAFNLGYRPWLYAPLMALHFSLLMRIGGDVTGLSWVRRWGALGNALSIISFLILIPPMIRFPGRYETR